MTELLQPDSPSGLKIQEQDSTRNITITLGDDVNFGKIIHYLAWHKIIDKMYNPFDDDLNYFSIKKNCQINIEIPGESAQDTFRLKLHEDMYDDNRGPQKPLIYDCTKQRLHITSDHKEEFAVYKNYIETCHAPSFGLSAYYYPPYYRVCKDHVGNLSLFKEDNDGNVYMFNGAIGAIRKNNKTMEQISGKPLSNIPQNMFRKISHTYGSNILSWWRCNIDEYSSVYNKPSPIKRFGRILIGQNGMTGQCLWGSGCCSCDNSGYNDAYFLNKDDINNIDFSKSY